MNLGDALGDWPSGGGNNPPTNPSWPAAGGGGAGGAWPGGPAPAGGGGAWPGGPAPAGGGGAWPGGPAQAGGGGAWPAGPAAGGGGWPAGPAPAAGGGAWPGPQPGGQPGGGGAWPGPQPGGQMPSQPSQPGWPSPSPGPGPGPGPGHGYAPQQNLTVPYSMTLPSGVHDKMLITIAGTIKSNADKFAVDLKTPTDLAFHFNPRFNEGGKKVIVRNSRISNNWGKEERDLQNFPFQQGKPFEMKILCTNKEFKVAVNNSHVLAFHHRVSNLRSINTLNIHCDVTLSKVNFETMP